MKRSRWATILLTVVLLLVVEATIGLVYIYSGSYDVAATGGVAPLSQHMVREGAEHYGEMCAGCHGAPGQKPAAFLAEGMTPSPPNLEEAAEEMSGGGEEGHEHQEGHEHGQHGG